jgi:FOG: TPR repeat, SEL1 subfamily
MYDSALQLYIQKKYEECIEKLSEMQAVDEGYAKMNRLLGQMHWKGHGAPINYASAIHYYQKAHAGGDKEAAVNLGHMHAQGHGGRVDYGLAMLFYEEGHAAGIANTTLNLGEMYAAGKGVLVDHVAPIELLLLIIQ